MADFRSQRVSDWVPADHRKAQVPSVDGTEALWALVRLWSETAGRPPRTRRYWAGLAEQARETPIGDGTTAGAPDAPVPDYALDRLRGSDFAWLSSSFFSTVCNTPRPSYARFLTASPESPYSSMSLILWYAQSGDPDELAIARAVSRFRSRIDPDETIRSSVFVLTNLPARPAPDVNRLLDLRASATASDRELATELHQLRALGVVGYSVLPADEVRRLLAADPVQRRLYTGLLAPDNALSRLGQLLADPGAQDIAPSIRANLAAELLADQWVRLGQAGADGDRQKLSLGPIAVDLEASADRPGDPETVWCAQYVLERGDEVLRPSRPATRRALRHLALIGGPGQGKSTLGQLVCQAYRVALLGEDREQLLPASTRALLTSLRGDLAAAGIPEPRSRRWPVRIVLHDFANHLAAGGDANLLRYLADRIGRRTPGPMDEARLTKWLAAWPCFLVLDGLDEVSAPETREEVMAAIEQFLLHMRGLDADLLVLATTRPQGYRAEFHIGDFEPLTLSPLSPEAATHYAERLADARHADDPEMREAVVARFAEAAQQPATARLMSTPLQVTIMSLLVERRTRMPQNRYELFESYYATIYAREVDKPGETGRLLAEHRGHIDWMHQYVGLTLQSRAALDGELDSVLAEEELHERALNRLTEETEDPGLARKLTSALFAAATERLVLLVAPDAGRIGFEVRSLQEFMAAKALVSGPENEILPRLQRLAASPAWNNTWLLAAAGLFSHRPHLRDGLLAVLRALDTESRAAMTLRPGAYLAADLLGDDFATAHPRHHRLLVGHAVEVLDGPPGPQCGSWAVGVGRAAQQSTAGREIVEQAVRRALRSQDARRMTAGLLPALPSGIGADARAATTFNLNLVPQEVRKHKIRFRPTDPTRLPDIFRHHYRTVRAEPLAEVLAPFLDRCRNAGPTGVDLSGCFVQHFETSNGVLRALSRPGPDAVGEPSGEFLGALAEAVDAQGPESWVFAAQLHAWLGRLTASPAVPPRVAGIN
ncbi:NACHT domain-containing protein [Kitasatospora sp. NPDC088134]|uniref:NACHT domain-containing protein n=1 Tax=Kitasatospora sp. NPDC088134 TaxID=3364071 RepID=UPI0037F885C1